MGRRALLIVNRQKPSVIDALDDVRTIINAHGSIAAELDATDEPLTHNHHNADIVVVLGGDGTFLAQVRRTTHLGLPMLGVNFGRVGFLAAYDLESLRAHAHTLFSDHPLLTEQRMLLEATVRCPDSGEQRCRQLALNDAAIVAGPPYRMITIELQLDDVKGPTIEGDGLIVSTGTGSTGYSVSAGGPILAPGVQAFSVAAIAAHSLGFRPLVVPADCHMLLRMTQVNPRAEEIANRQREGQPADDNHGTTLVLDGQWHQRLRHNDEISIRRAPQHATLVRNPDRNYYETLMHKMHWASSPRSTTPANT